MKRPATTMEIGGAPNSPFNELVRLRTRTGHQILMHNSEDLIYIGNAKGTTWIEMTANGKIDIFAKKCHLVGGHMTFLGTSSN